MSLANSAMEHKDNPGYRKRILYINFDYPPMSGPGIWRAVYFTKYLSTWGHDITVICSDKSHWFRRYDQSLLKILPQGIRVMRLKSAYPLEALQKLEKGFEKIRLRHIALFTKKFSWLIRNYYPEPYLFWFCQVLVVGSFLSLKRKGFDCLITSGPPHISHVFGWLLQKIVRTQWIMDYRDLWTDDQSQSPPEGYRRRLFVALERKCIRSASAVVTVSPSWTNHFREKYRGIKAQDHFFEIRNGHNFEKSDLSSGRAYRSNGRLHIHFNGVPQPLSETDTLLCAVKKFKTIYDGKYALPLFTFSGLPIATKTKIKSLGLNDCMLDVKMMSYEDSVRYSLSSDVLTVIVNNDNLSRLGTIPAKTYEAMALQRHIFAIIPNNSDVRELMEEYGNATISDVSDVDDVCRGIGRLVRLHYNGELYDGMEEEKSNLIFQKYSRKIQAMELSNLINTLSLKDNRE